MTFDRLSFFKRSALGLPLLLGVLLQGCFSTPAAKPERFYFLSAPAVVPDRGGQGLRVAVDDFTTAPGYDSQRLAYRRGNEVRYYGYRQWLASPSSLLTETTIRMMRASGRFAIVDHARRLRDAEVEIDGHVVAMEEVDSGDRWHAHLAMTLSARAERSGKTLVSHAFDETRPCARRDPSDVARVMSKILADRIDKLGQAILKTTP
ncbi:MAG: membrane integrity-associated transporter subunit PqiC [Deltaproteobacteria bacterium]|nr:membrane integrity-associated transporter subunit PqiC [Deltaproteobacteria bacterium]